MRRQFLLMIVTAIALGLLLLGGCGSTHVNVSSTRPPEQASTTPAVSEKQKEVSTAPTKPQAQPGPEQRAPQAQHASPSNRAEEVLRQAREALGGEARLKDIQNFTASGSFRRVSDEQEQSGEKRIDFLLPDKFKVSDTLSLIAGIELTIVNALNGNQSWSDARTSTGNAQVMMMSPGGNEQQNTEEPAKRLRAQFTRYMLALFLMPSPGSSIEYGGEAEAADGRADILTLEDANGNVARLFIDKNTHRPLMISYRDIPPLVRTRKSMGTASSADIDKIAREAKTKAPPPREEADMQMHFSDYKPEKGILLPHLITITVNDKPHEEWSLKSFKVNSPDLTDKKFEKGE